MINNTAFVKLFKKIFNIETSYDNYLLPEKLVFNEYEINHFLTCRFLVKQ